MSRRAVLCLLLASCSRGAPEAHTVSSSHAAAPAAEPISLELVDDYNPPRPPPDEAITEPGARWDAALGGLSGLHYQRESATLYAISDVSPRFPPRIYAFDVALTEGSLDVSPRAVLRLRGPAPARLLEELDAESITGDGSGGFYVGTEGGIDRPAQPLPSILRLQQDGLIAGALALPEAYLPSTDGEPRGTRTNRAFEGVASSPSGRWLTAIVESPLHQDGPDADFEHGGWVRLLRWDLASPGDPAEYLYPIEPLPRPARGTPAGGNNGVSELVSLDDRRLLVLERAYVPLAEGQGPNTIRIFEVTLPDAPAPAGSPPVQLPKRLVLDLDDIVPRLEPGQQSLDNMEGMTVGPELRDGTGTLLLVTDDNFRAEQRTVFLAFRLRGLR